MSIIPKILAKRNAIKHYIEIREKWSLQNRSVLEAGFVPLLALGAID